MPRKQLFIEFSDTGIRMIEATKKRKTLVISNQRKIGTGGADREMLTAYLQDLVPKKRFRQTPCVVLVSKSTVVTKNIELPFMKPKEMAQFFTHNAHDYFTTNHQSYSFIHHVTEEYEVDKESYDGQVEHKKMMNVMLSAMPTDELEDIKEACRANGLRIMGVETYADVILKTFAREEKDLAFLDINDERVSFTMSKGKSLFMHAAFNPKDQDEFSYSFSEGNPDTQTTILNNVRGYLNFYSSKNYGNKPSMISVFGEDEMAEHIQTHMNMDFNDIVSRNHLPFTVKEKMRKGSFSQEEHLGLLSCAYTYAKDSNTNLLESLGEKEKKDYLSVAVSTLMIVTALLWSGYSSVYPYYEAQNASRTLSELRMELGSHLPLKAKYDEHVALSTLEQNKFAILSQMKGNQISFGRIITVINSSLPEGSRMIQFKYGSDGSINTLYEMDNSELAGTLVDNINQLGVFEPVHLESVSLNGGYEPISLNLKLREDVVKEFTERKGKQE